jgi:transcriptional regulator with XRE-family HTH domain
VGNDQRPGGRRTRQRRRTSGDRQLGDRIRRARIRLNLSQEVAAHQIGRSAGWLLQVENGRADPGYSDLLLLAPVLKVEFRELLTGQTTSAAADFHLPVLSEIHSGAEGSVDRREFSKGIVGSLLAVPGVLDWERADAIIRHDRIPDPELMRQVHALVSAVTATTVKQLDRGSPDQLAPLLHGSLSFVQSLPCGSDRPPELADAMSRLALLYGWLSFQLDNKTASCRIYRYAAHLARDSELTDIYATILAAASQLDSTIPYGGYQSSNGALLTLDHAASLTSGSSSPSILRSWILARRAQERAALRDVPGAQRDFATAEDAFHPSTVMAETFYAYPSEGWITGFEASCNRLAHRWPEAEDAYSRVLSHPSSPLWRAVTMSSLASVQARQNDPARAATTLKDAVTLAIETGAPLRLRHIYGTRSQLDPFRDTPAVQALDHFLSQVASV